MALVVAVKMPWGKHKGEDVEDLPTDYLQWIAENVTGSDALIREVENQLVLREGRGVERPGR